MGDHTETLEVDFDPATVSFADLLELFWQGHDPHAATRSRQYMSALFWHDARQRASVEEAAARLSRERGGAAVTTALRSYEGFHLAEDYHQKYTLRRHREFAAALVDAYPDPLDLVNSTAAARLNGYLAGHGSRRALEQDLPLLGLDAEARERLRTLHDQ